MSHLKAKVALVVDANSGMRRATAKWFAAEGAKLVPGTCRDAELPSLVAGGASITRT